MSRGTTAVIDFDNLRHNFKVLQELSPGKLVLVVKADAYGHGLKQVVQALENVDCFAVATIDEAQIIRQYRPNVKILLLEGFLDKHELKTALQLNLDSVIHQQLQLDMLNETTAHNAHESMNIWLKYDSGMNRLGFTQREYTLAIKSLEKNKCVKELILMSHLASADQRQNPFSALQKQKFLNCSQGHQLSLSNSSALLNNWAIKDEWCRVGISLFGVSPIKGRLASDYNLKPVMTLKTNIIAIKSINAGETIGYGQTYLAKTNMKIAIIGIGYGDGYPWSLGVNASVKLNQQQAKIVGRVSMDMMAIDVTKISNVAVGNSVLIWGKNTNGSLPIETVASHAKSIPYVLLCHITSRVHYQYVK